MGEILGDVDGENGPKIPNQTQKQKREAELKQDKAEEKPRKKDARKDGEKGGSHEAATQQLQTGVGFFPLFCFLFLAVIFPLFFYYLKYP